MRRQNYTVALILPPQSAYSSELTEGIMERHLEHQDWTLIQLPRLIIGRSPLPAGKWRLDGAIIWAEPRDQWVCKLLEKQVKVVSFGSEWECPGVTSIQLRVDDLHQEVLAHFKKLGLRHLLTLAHRLDQRPAVLRTLESFATAARAGGMRPEIRDIGGKLSPGTAPQRLLNPEAEHELAAILTALPKPAGVFCGSDHIGFIVCEVAARLGLRVPEDLAVVGQGGNLVGTFARPPLTTVVGPAREAGRAAADCLAQWLATGKPPAEHQVIAGASLIKRESTVGKSDNVVLEAVRRLIIQRAKGGVGLAELVTLSKLNSKTLSRRYRAAFGTEPMEEIQRLRIAEIKRLLAASKTNVTAVAADCGFSSLAAFSNYFKRHTGMAPADYRARAATGEEAP